MYARDISEKIRSSHRLCGSMNERTVIHPYRYMKSAENKKKRIIEPEAATVVKNIFKMCLEDKCKNRTQRIVINYRFVGYVEIPEVSRRANIIADTRKGVAIEYLTEPKTA